MIKITLYVYVRELQDFQSGKIDTLEAKVSNMGTAKGAVVEISVPLDKAKNFMVSSYVLNREDFKDAI